PGPASTVLLAPFATNTPAAAATPLTTSRRDCRENQDMTLIAYLPLCRLGWPATHVGRYRLDTNDESLSSPDRAKEAHDVTVRGHVGNAVLLLQQRLEALQRSIDH